MNTLTGEVAHDVAWSRPPAIPGALILGYNGSARATREQVEAWAKPFLMGFESSTTRAYAGGDAGDADAGFSCSSFDEVGYPRECGSWFCAADTPSTPAQFLGNIEEYAYRYALRMIDGGRSGPLAAYGNPAAVDAACRGITRAGLVALRWKVGTWGMGEGGGPNQPPAEADAELVQSGNTPGQAEGTDLNWLYVLTAVFCAWFGPTTSAPDPIPMEDDMLVGLKARPGGVANDFDAFLVDGGVIIRTFAGDQAPLGFLTVPEDAADYCADRKVKPLELNGIEWALIEKRTTATLGDNGDDGDPPTPSVDLAPVRAAVAVLVDELAKV